MTRGRRYAPARVTWALVVSQSGDRSDALGALLKALELNPSMSEVQELLRSLR